MQVSTQVGHAGLRVHPALRARATATERTAETIAHFKETLKELLSMHGDAVVAKAKLGPNAPMANEFFSALWPVLASRVHHMCAVRPCRGIFAASSAFRCNTPCAAGTPHVRGAALYM